MIDAIILFFHNLVAVAVAVAVVIVIIFVFIFIIYWVFINF
jgi:hypothetical protein